MNQIIPLRTDTSTTRQAQKSQPLRAGQYWRAIANIPSEGISKGMVLLIESLPRVDNRAHTVILRAHPSLIGQSRKIRVGKETRYIRYSEHRFLVDKFLQKFVFEPEHEQVRRAEMEAIQGRVAALQNEMVTTTSDPALMNAVIEEEMAERDIKAPFPLSDPTALPGLTIAGAIASGITEASVARMKHLAEHQHQIATIKSEWIQAKTREIAETIESLAPFYKEMAASALAQTEGAREFISGLLEGIASLDLYLGKDVEVHTVRQGAAAPIEEPLTIMQRKLVMDEEMALWQDVEETFDASQQHVFFDALRNNPGLVDQIFPSPRCVLVMATTHRAIDYGNPLESAIRAKANREVFLLVRDGENIHQVVSGVESHLGADRLFPNKDDQDRIFQGSDGSQITFQDVRYTDALKDHDRFALHYRRFLLLLCGLDHRLGLLGKFYVEAQGFEFMTLAFQEKYFRFIHDDGGSANALATSKQPASLSEWWMTKNAYLQSGSRVLARWNDLMTEDACPAIYSRSYYRDNRERRYHPAEKLSVAIARKDGPDHVCDIKVTSPYRKRTFNARVALPTYGESLCLCLDNVTPEEIDWHLLNRDERSTFRHRNDRVFLIRFLKKAHLHLSAELEAERDTRQRLKEALLDGRIVTTGDEADGLVQRAAMAWRAAHRGAPLPRFVDGKAPEAWPSLLNQMFLLSPREQSKLLDAADFARVQGYIPLRAAVSGKSKVLVYAEPKAEERDDRVHSHYWVKRLTLQKRADGRYRIEREAWTLLPQFTAGETALYRDEKREECWPHRLPERAPSRLSPQTKEAYFRAAEAGAALLPVLKRLVQAGPAPDSFTPLFAAWKEMRETLGLRSKRVVNPELIVPVGVLGGDRGSMRLLCVTVDSPVALLARLGTPEQVAQLRREFIDEYANKSAGADFFKEAQEAGTGFSLCIHGDLLRGDSAGDFFTAPVGSRLGGKEPWRRSLDAWIAGHRSKYPDHVIWLALAGESPLDVALGIEADGDIAPVTIGHTTSRKGSGQPYDEYLEVYPSGQKEDAVFLDCTSMSEYRNLGAALAELREEYAGCLIPSGEIPEAPQPKTGVIRFYLKPPPPSS